MLNNNFKKLLFFGNKGSFTNVLNNSVTLADMVTATASYTTNNHTNLGTGRSFNYTTTLSSNTLTQELTTYPWHGITTTSSNDNMYEKHNGFTLFVGSGTTAPTVNDYKLDTPVELDVLAASCYQNEDGKVITTRTFYNNTGSSVTLNEIGLYLFKPAKNAAGSSGTQPIVMLGRKVFNNPVTIAAGDSYTFTYTVDMSDITLNPTA